MREEAIGRREFLQGFMAAMAIKPRPEGFSDGTKLIPGRPYEAINPGTPRGKT